MIRTYVFGKTGRMGQMVCEILQKHPQFELLGGYSQKDPTPWEGPSPDMVIDFSLPQALPELIAFVKKHKSGLVSGTTGYSQNQFNQLKELGRGSPVFWAANMSFGVYLMCQLTETLALYEKYYNYEIEEAHHIHKKDKPSGTALIIEQAARKNTQKISPIKSIREGEIFGIHKVVARSPLESIEIRHKANDRFLFAQGAVDVALWLKGQPNGFYSMDNFFETITQV